MDFDSLFQTYEKWKRLPAYRLEPRIDVFIAYYMPVSIQRKLGFTVSEVIPELPIRLGTIYPNVTSHPNRSYKVDFYALSEKGDNLFIEVKSDTGSRRKAQDKYLQRSSELGMSEILLGIKKIYSVTSFKKKYDFLQSELKRIGLVDNTFNPSCEIDKIQVIYIQPRLKEGESNSNVITFNDLANDIEIFNSDPFSIRFAKSLRLWSVD